MSSSTTKDRFLVKFSRRSDQ